MDPMFREIRAELTPAQAERLWLSSLFQGRRDLSRTNYGSGRWEAAANTRLGHVHLYLVCHGDRAEVVVVSADQQKGWISPGLERTITSELTQLQVKAWKAVYAQTRTG